MLDHLNYLLATLYIFVVMLISLFLGWTVIRGSLVSTLEQTRSKLVEQLRSDINSARDILHKEAAQLKKELLNVPYLSNLPDQPVDGQMVTAAEKIYVSLINWTKVLSESNVDEYTSKRIIMGEQSALLEGTLEAYFIQARDLYYRARVLQNVITESAIYVDTELHGELDQTTDRVLQISRAYLAAARNCHEAKDTLEARDFLRSFAQVEAAHTQLVDYCDAVFIPFVRDSLAVRFRQIRSIYALESAGHFRSV